MSRVEANEANWAAYAHTIFTTKELVAALKV